LQYVGLPTAAALVHHHVVGSVPDARDSARLSALLNDVAHALSNIVPIYVSDPEGGSLRELAPVELIDGKFDRGAHVFVTRRGDEIQGLVIQRRDMLSAIGVLRGAGVRFKRRGETD
jgi:hypothetical protein